MKYTNDGTLNPPALPNRCQANAFNLNLIRPELLDQPGRIFHKIARDKRARGAVSGKNAAAVTLWAGAQGPHRARGRPGGSAEDLEFVLE